MIFGIDKEMDIFLYAMLSGITAAAVYQFLSVVRTAADPGKMISGMQDFLYWIWVSLYLYKRMYDTTFGEIRWFFLLGTGVGALFAGLFFRRIKNRGKGKEKP